MVALLVAIYAALLGLVVGSYLNVVIYRVPRGLSTVTPRSRCPSCQSAIRPWDNIPVLSWLVLGGKCRSCKMRISARYPAIEAVTAVFFVLCFLRWGPSVDALSASIFSAAMIALAAIDAEHFLLPDKITYPGIALGLLLQPFRYGPGPRSAVIGAALGAGLLLAIWAGWYLLRKEEGMGLGDVKMLAMIGAFLGWKSMLVTFFFAVLSGAIVGVFLVITGRLRNEVPTFDDDSDEGPAGISNDSEVESTPASFSQAKLPFGVFLSLGALISQFVGDALANSYLSLL